MVNLSDLQIDSTASYMLAFFLPAFDAVIPVLPSETAIVALGVTTAGSADPRIVILIALAAAGAFVGDNLCYLIGRRFGPWVNRKVFSSGRGVERKAWAERTLERFGARLIVVCRFIPGGRTAVMLTCGVVHFPRRRFIPATAVAGVIWASYAFFMGRLGGKAFQNHPWQGLLLALGLALTVTLLIEVVRLVVSRRRRTGTAV
ncbi:MAG TPA: DedA family protein [Acidimicrobiales bacterium]|nr:DedA family protein [Acidimicrobiales bacterium]